MAFVTNIIALFTIASYAIYAASADSFSASRTVTTPLGKITGIACTANQDVTQYLGIPFAEPMLGSNRYRPPTMYSQMYPEPSLNATAFPPPCGSFCSLDADADVSTSENSAAEDCLFLNVWSPAHATTDSKLPVRVYIHGGSVNMCSASDSFAIGCSGVAKTNMIHINIQFRRGPFGYFAHPLTLKEYNTTGNWGFLDQQLALNWVQKYIVYFGGDPEKVLLNGQSGGGQLVDFHQVAPGSAGLFSSAISQSPPCVKLVTLEMALNTSATFMGLVGCAPLATPELELECMRNTSWDTLMEESRAIGLDDFAEILLCEGPGWTPFFHYVLDGTVFTEQIEESLVKGHFHNVPYMVGSNTNEGSYFQNDIESYLDKEGFSSVVELLATLYPNADFNSLLPYYTASNFKSDVNFTAELMAHVWTDIFYTCPIHKRLVARASAGAPGSNNTYLYSWNVTMSCPPENYYLGATHTAELRASFGIVTDIYTESTPSGTCNYNDEEVGFSDALLTAWSSMALENQPKWPAGKAWRRWTPELSLGAFFSKQNRTKVMHLDPGPKCLVLEETLRGTKVQEDVTLTAQVAM